MKKEHKNGVVAFLLISLIASVVLLPAVPVAAEDYYSPSLNVTYYPGDGLEYTQVHEEDGEGASWDYTDSYWFDTYYFDVNDNLVLANSISGNFKAKTLTGEYTFYDGYLPLGEDWSASADDYVCTSAEGDEKCSIDTYKPSDDYKSIESYYFIGAVDNCDYLNLSGDARTFCKSHSDSKSIKVFVEKEDKASFISEETTLSEGSTVDVELRIKTSRGLEYAELYLNPNCIQVNSIAPFDGWSLDIEESGNGYYYFKSDGTAKGGTVAGFNITILSTTVDNDEEKISSINYIMTMDAFVGNYVEQGCGGYYAGTCSNPYKLLDDYLNPDWGGNDGSDNEPEIITDNEGYFANATEIFVGQTVEVEYNGVPKYYVFKPTQSGSYAFLSSDNIHGDEGIDPYVRLYGKYGNGYVLLDYNDDGDVDLNFELYYELEAGESYYIEADTYYGDEESGSYKLNVAFDEREKAEGTSGKSGRYGDMYYYGFNTLLDERSCGWSNWGEITQKSVYRSPIYEELSILTPTAGSPFIPKNPVVPTNDGTNNNPNTVDHTISAVAILVISVVAVSVFYRLNAKKRRSE